MQTLEAVKRKQFEKYHAASAEEQATIERNPYTIFHQALKNCEPVIGLVPILKGGHFYQVSGQGVESWAKIGRFLGTRNCQDLAGRLLCKNHRQKMEEGKKISKRPLLEPSHFCPHLVF